VAALDDPGYFVIVVIVILIAVYFTERSTWERGANLLAPLASGDECG
jgi:hypothetical protein